MRFLRDVTLSFGAQIIGTVVAAVTSIVVARAWGPEGRGLYSLLLFCAMILGLVGDMGLGAAAIFYIGRKTYTARTSASILITASWLIGSSIALVLVLVLTQSGTRVIGGVSVGFIAVIALFTPVLISKRYAGSLFAALQDFAWYGGLNLSESVIRLLCIVALLILGWGSKGILLAVVLSALIPATVGWVRIRQGVGELRLKLEPTTTRAFVNYGYRIYLAELVSFLSLRVDQLLIGLFLGIGQVGIYAVALSISELTRSFALAVAIVLFSRVPSLDSEAASRLTAKTARMVIALSILAVVLLLIFGSFVISILFGQEFDSAAPVLWLLLPGVVMVNLSEILQNDLAGRGKPQIGMYTKLVSLLVIVTGDVLLLPVYGIMGAALVASVSQTIGALILLTVFLRTTRQPLRNVLLMTRADLSTVSSYASLARTRFAEALGNRRV